MPRAVDLLGVLSCGRVLSLAVRSAEIGPFSARSQEAPCCWHLFFASFRSRLIGCVNPSQFICVKKKGGNGRAEKTAWEALLDMENVIAMWKKWVREPIL